jgi:hypothetical protein
VKARYPEIDLINPSMKSFLDRVPIVPLRAGTNLGDKLKDETKGLFGWKGRDRFTAYL